MPITEHEPGGFRDRCDRCGGWISMGHAEGSRCRWELKLKWDTAEGIRESINRAGGYDGEGPPQR